MTGKSSVDKALEQHWSGLGLVKRLDLIRALEIAPENKDLVEGQTLDKIIQMKQDDLPAVVRGRLICALTPEGFSVEEYQRTKEAMLRPSRPELN